MDVTFEPAEPAPIAYHRGAVYVTLTGAHAWLYRAMIWAYGQDEATERFWWLWNKKSGDNSPAVTAPSL